LGSGGEKMTDEELITEIEAQLHRSGARWRAE
jgi:hypothetical protein